MMFTQVNVGRGDKNSHIEIQNGIVIIDPNSRNRYTISELWEVLINQFEMKDQEINQQLPQNVLINQTEGKPANKMSSPNVSLTEEKFTA